MTLRTGQGVKSTGLTLIELILVMALLAVVISVSMPSLRGFFQGRNLDSEARRFLSLTHYAQSRAVSEGLPMMLWIDAEEGAYGLRAANGYVAEDPYAVEYRLAPELEIEIATTVLTAFGGGFASLASGVTVEPVIWFMPDGFIRPNSPDRVVIRQAENDAIAITQTTNQSGYAIERER